MHQDGADGEGAGAPGGPARGTGIAAAPSGRVGAPCPGAPKASGASPRGGGGGRPAAHSRRRAAALGLIAAGALLSSGAGLRAAGADPCGQAARLAAEAHGVPLVVMRAVLHAETGLGQGAARAGWPWSANADGRAHRFASREAALAFAEGPEGRAARNVDLGCFQISRLWHEHAFSGAAEMLDPARNALYAARLLKDHHARTGDWTQAAGAFHSRTEAHAAPYRAKVRTELATLGPAAPAPPERSTPSGAAPLLASARSSASGAGAARRPSAAHGIFTRVAGLAPAPLPATGLGPAPRQGMGQAPSPQGAASGRGGGAGPPAAPEQLASAPRLASHPPLVAPAALLGAARPLSGARGPLLPARGAAPMRAVGGVGAAGAAGSLVPASAPGGARLAREWGG